jgi:predicted ArsR family transcriptional regulator
MTEADTDLQDVLAPTKRRVLVTLRREGDLSLENLAGSLGVSKTATLRHVNDLEERGFVARSFHAGKRGRPRVHFRLTEESAKLFPQAYTEMTLAALDFVDEKLGRPAVVKLLERRTNEVHDRHEQDFSGQDFGARVRELVRIRDEGGYMAEMGEARRNEVEVLEFNCPVLAVAESYPEACTAEVAMFQKLLRADVEVSQRVVAGDAVCRFIIRREGAKHARRKRKHA